MVFIEVSAEDAVVLDGGLGIVIIVVLEEADKVLEDDAGPGNLRKEMEMASSYANADLGTVLILSPAFLTFMIQDVLLFML